ncbi:hypothetical protein KY362_06220 [Candidatus Woesearchaeota archaeon]|nr:hypothetical protein [Candidatus Woesearchaeota archaeon]
MRNLIKAILLISTLVLSVFIIGCGEEQVGQGTGILGSPKPITLKATADSYSLCESEFDEKASACNYIKASATAAIMDRVSALEVESHEMPGLDFRKVEVILPRSSEAKPVSAAWQGTASCPSGYTLIGGGCEHRQDTTISGGDITAPYLMSDHITETGDSQSCAWNSHAGRYHKFVVQAYCLKLS